MEEAGEKGCLLGRGEEVEAPMVKMNNVADPEPPPGGFLSPLSAAGSRPCGRLPAALAIHDCSKWLAKENVIIPVDADHPAGGHTFILESGHMIPNLDYPDDLKDACTRALHAHIETKPRRQLVGAGEYQYR